MKAAVLSSLAFAAGTQALVARGDSCCFSLTADGGPGGIVGQLGDGQNRIGEQGLPTGSYCLKDGMITDGKGRGCILTPPTTQLQCDEGAKPDGGFALTCDGILTHDGDSTFYTCPTGDHGAWNLYSETLKGEPRCTKTTLMADKCMKGCPKPASTCPRDLTGSWEFPHLITPVDSANPHKAYGTSYNGQIAGSVSSIFNFDIPMSDKGKTCTLEFLFPKQSQLETSSFTMTGSGEVHVAALMSPADASTTYGNMPKVSHDLGMHKFAPGNAYTLATYPCPAGQRVAIEISPVGDTCLNYFQDYNPCPIGLYIQTSD